MNSSNTNEETRSAMAKIDPRKSPDMFLQHNFPKILQKNYKPAIWPENPALEWNPAGHGDLYAALYSSGMLESLLKDGIEYGFVSNADNLGASLDASLLGYFADKNLPFMMEVTKRTESDSKGGHLARDKNGRLTLRECAQCLKEDLPFFSDIDRHPFFNTNNIWINFRFLYESIRKEKIIRLPVVLSLKNICPGDEKSPFSYQIETAMGAAISLFEGAEAVRVERSRFFPVKKCEDLMALRSDRFLFSTKNGLFTNQDAKHESINIHLDQNHYGRLKDFEKRFPGGVPSLSECRSLEIKGDVFFGGGVVIKGDVTIANRTKRRATVPEGSVLEKDVLFD